MNIVELRNVAKTRTFVAQGLWLGRVAAPDSETVKLTLEWTLELASQGEVLPPIGFIGDIGLHVFRVPFQDLAARTGPRLPGLPTTLSRRYEDYVLGKFFADASFDRAADALRRYQGRDQGRGLAYFLARFQERSHVDGVILNPAVLKAMVRDSPDAILEEGWQSSQEDGVLPELVHAYEALIKATRQTAEVLGQEDVFELEHGTALTEFGQRLALRQTLTAARMFEDLLPPYRPVPLAGRQEVPSRVLDEDTYPVGGFSSLSTRGTVESLLHSQLAYMEKDESPDLFDIKFLRDELLYYSRDENTFLRRRRTFVFALFPDLVQMRHKDAELPYQRIILLLALLVVLVRELIGWLSDDALRFEIVFLEKPKGASPLAPERELLEMLLREPIANGLVEVRSTPNKSALAKQCALSARRSMCHCLSVATKFTNVVAEDTVVHPLRLLKSAPEVHEEDGVLMGWDDSDAVANWVSCLERLLRLWI